MSEEEENKTNGDSADKEVAAATENNNHSGEESSEDNKEAMPNDSQVRMKAHVVLEKVKKSEERRTPTGATPLGTPRASTTDLPKEEVEANRKEEEAADAAIRAATLKAEETAAAAAASAEAAKQEEEDEAAAVAEAKLKKEKEIEDKKKESSEELTKRLQKLALERQKENRHDRLKVIQADATSHLSSAKTFQELKLPEHLLKAIFEMGFERPSAIQEEALPRILANPPRNVIGQAQSGSGKTAAFVLGMLFRVVIDTPASCQVRFIFVCILYILYCILCIYHVLYLIIASTSSKGLCVTPTRELAVQIFQNAVTPMAAHMKGLKVRLALAGEQIARGEKLDAHIVIGTPGKVVDWLKRRIIDTKKIKVFVLDEADNMVAESGHRANSLLIKKQMPKGCQSLLFSATFPDEVIAFAEKMVFNPDKILIESGPEFLVSDIQLWLFMKYVKLFCLVICVTDSVYF